MSRSQPNIKQTPCLGHDLDMIGQIDPTSFSLGRDEASKAPMDFKPYPALQMFVCIWQRQWR